MTDDITDAKPEEAPPAELADDGALPDIKTDPVPEDEVKP